MANQKSWEPLGVNSPNKGQIVEASIDEQDFIVWRSESGKLSVTEARCPHQWSHLAYEGAVVGEELICTSHFWRFSLTGLGCKENINGRRDQKSNIKVFPCRELDGQVWVQIN